MIKTALKHWIYEECINVLFNGITSNFFLTPEKDWKVGDKFDYIIFRCKDDTLVITTGAKLTEDEFKSIGMYSFHSVSYARYIPLNYTVSNRSGNDNLIIYKNKQYLLNYFRTSWDHSLAKSLVLEWKRT